jgi:hypothetical protein
MSQTRVLVADNIELLRQGFDLLGGLDAELYARAADGRGRSSIGSHFRHCLDFFASFLAGVEIGRVDYCARERSEMVARHLPAAAERVERVVSALQALSYADAHAPLFVRAEGAADAADPAAWTRSSLGRELQALLSHTVHHYAIIATILRLEGIEPGDEFGVAPSTLAHWRKVS